jgi:hypothetical protein
LKKKTKTKLILLIIATIFLYSSSITTSTVAQDKSITIYSYGCVSCSLDYNEYHVDWSYSGDIPNVAIYLYNLSMTVIEYIVTAMTTNLGSFGQPISGYPILLIGLIIGITSVIAAIPITKKLRKR